MIIWLSIGRHEVYRYKWLDLKWLGVLFGKHVDTCIAVWWVFKVILLMFRHHSFVRWICTRSTAVKFGIPFGPVLKHGPRSLSSMQVNEYMKLICVKNLTVMGLRVVLCTAPQSRGIFINICSNVYGKYTMSILDITRKKVSYACALWSQVKTWWRYEAVLTCKSIVGHVYRGERPIEPSSSWFLPKFPSG